MRPPLEEIRGVVAGLVAEAEAARGGDGEGISLQTRLRADLDFTSLDLIHLLASLDMRFRRKLKYEMLLLRGGQLADDVSVGELSDFVFEHFEDQLTGPAAM